MNLKILGNKLCNYLLCYFFENISWILGQTFILSTFNCLNNLSGEHMSFLFSITFRVPKKKKIKSTCINS